MAQLKLRSRERSRSSYKRKYEGNHESSVHDSHHISHHHDQDSKYHHHKRSRRSNSPDSEAIPPWDDEERHYKIRLGEDLTPRYKILSLMGEGTFGRVVECWDRQIKKAVAVKIVRAIEKYRDAAKLEIEVLDTLRESDPTYSQPLIQMLHWFDFRDHICMVFEKHGLSLYDFMHKNSFRPFSLTHVREMGYQLLHSIAYLHSLTLIHTDLKPENILLENADVDIIENPPRPRNSVSEFSSLPLRVPRDPRIRLIDFGSATFSHRYHTTVVSTRHYRAPEIIMGMGWSYPCDIWSVACILLQLYNGDTLFQTRENREHLAMMERVLGKFPEYFVDRADRHSRKYFKNGSIVFPAEDVTSSHERAKQLAYLKHMNKLSEYIAPEDDLFLDLLTQLFEYDPAKRMTAKEALKHPFFDEVRELYQYKDPKENREKEICSRERENNREYESRERRDRDRDYRDQRGYRDYRDERDYRDYRGERDYRDNNYRDYYREHRENRDFYREYRDYPEDEYYREHRERDGRDYRDNRDRNYRDYEREFNRRYREEYRERERDNRDRYEYRGR